MKKPKDFDKYFNPDGSAKHQPSFQEGELNKELIYKMAKWKETIRSMRHEMAKNGMLDERLRIKKEWD
jgi:hypothetical protein